MVRLLGQLHVILSQFYPVLFYQSSSLNLLFFASLPPRLEHQLPVCPQKVALDVNSPWSVFSMEGPHVFLLLLFLPACEAFFLLLLKVGDQIWSEVPFWFPAVGAGGVAFPFDAIIDFSVLHFFLQDVFHLVALTHSVKRNCAILQINMTEEQQFEDCFQVDLPIPKVQDVFFLNSHQLLLLHVPHQYSIVDVLGRNHTTVIRSSAFTHPVSEQIQPLDSHSVLYIFQNSLHLFDLLTGTSIDHYQIPKSDIYEQQFQFHLPQDQSDHQVVFFKTSILKSTPVTVYYDIHLLRVSGAFQKLRRSKVEHQDVRQFGVCCGELCSYQTSGYTIEVEFMESGICHKINSIFRLFLIKADVQKEELLLYFTHEELENEFCCYSVNKKRAKKVDRRERPLDAHVYSDRKGSRSLVYKNCFNHRPKDHFSGIFRVKISKEAKYLGMLDHIVPEEMGNSFKQEVLSLLS